MEVYVEIFKKNLGHAVLEKTLRKKLRIVATNEIFSLKKFKIFNLQEYCYILCTKLKEMYGSIFRNFFKFFGSHSLEKKLFPYCRYNISSCTFRRNDFLLKKCFDIELKNKGGVF